MERQDLLLEMQRQNPWWSTGRTGLPPDTIKRDLFFGIVADLRKRKEMIAILGLRRVGKTTLLKTIVEHLLTEEATPPERVLYFSFDLATTGDRSIEPGRILKLYEEEVLRRPLDGSQGEVFVFFDEVQYVISWGAYLKSYYDRDAGTRFIVSGSSSMNITKGAGESLVGRIRMYHLAPFSFGEYLLFKGLPVKERMSLSKNELHIPASSVEIRIAFSEYLERGGLPEALLSTSYPPELLKQSLDLIFFRDIVEMFPVKRVDVLLGLFRLIAVNSGQKVNWTTLSNELDTQYRTIREYAQYLQDSYLLIKSSPYSGGTASRIRKNPKMYLADHAFCRIFPTDMGLKAETVAFDHIHRSSGEVGYMPSPEIDIMLPGLAIEVKYVGQPTRSDARSLLRAPDDHSLFMVTRDVYDTWDLSGRTVRLLPLWLFCLTVP